MILAFYVLPLLLLLHLLFLLVPSRFWSLVCFHSTILSHLSALLPSLSLSHVSFSFWATVKSIFRRTVNSLSERLEAKDVEGSSSDTFSPFVFAALRPSGEEMNRLVVVMRSI